MSDEVISPFLSTNTTSTSIDDLDPILREQNNDFTTNPLRYRYLDSATNTGSDLLLNKGEGHKNKDMIRKRASTTGGSRSSGSGQNTPFVDNPRTTNGVPGDRDNESNGSASNSSSGSSIDRFGVMIGSAPGSGRSIAIVSLVFIVSFLTIICLYSAFPNMDPSESQHIKLPRNIEDAKMLGTVLNRYKEKYYGTVLFGVFFVYIFLQTFAIPGSIFLSILSGFLFPFWLALLLVCFCSAMGASCCYGLSWLVGRRFIYKYFPEKVRAWCAIVDNHRNNLLNYIIFLRVTPFLPNWFINITSPVIGVPIQPFFLGTFFGVAPPSFVAIHAGTTLHKMTSSSDALTWTSLGVLILLGITALIPVLMKDRLSRRFH